MLNAIISKNEIIKILPHGESMCLIDGVMAYDEQTITCYSQSHRCGHNPLRSHHQLPIVSGIEYAAQVIAIHACLNKGEQEASAAGYLAKVTSLEFHAERLDDIATALIIKANRIVGNAASLLYKAQLYTEETCLLSGTLLISKQS